MGAAPDHAPSGALVKLGFAAAQVVQEYGYDSDVDDEFRFAVEDHTSTALEDEEYPDVADAALIWWRDGDGDLGDILVEALTNLVDRGFLVLLTPKAGRGGYIDASDVEDAATITGLHTSGTVNAGADWSATRLVAPRSARSTQPK